MLPVTVNPLAPSKIAPPSAPAELFKNAQPVTVSVPLTTLIAPPPALALPLATVTPEIATVGATLVPMAKTWYAPPPSMVSLLAPGPVMVTPLLIAGSALTSVIVPVAVKVIPFVSTAVPVVRLLRQLRNDPAPLSLVFETTQEAPQAP